MIVKYLVSGKLVSFIAREGIIRVILLLTNNNGKMLVLLFHIKTK